MKDWFLHIEEYITGQMNEADKAAFEQEMERNASLAEAVQNFDVGKLISQQFVEAEVTDLLLDLRSEKVEEKKPKKGFNLGRVLSVAASVLLIGFVGLLWYSNKYYSDEALIAEYYESPAYSGTRSDALSTDSLERAIQLFHLNRFEEAKELLENLDSDSEEKWLYLTHIYFLNNDIPELNEINEKSTSAEVLFALKGIENSQIEFNSRAKEIKHKKGTLFHKLTKIF